MKAFSPFIILSILLMSGCATQYQVRLDGLADRDAALAGGRRYTLVSDTPGVDTSDLFFKEVARHLEPVLRRSGYVPVEDGAAADVVIGLDAHLSEPMVETRSYSEPIYARTYRHGYRVQIPVVSKDGKVVRFVTSYYPGWDSYHYAGSVERDRQYTVFDKVLRLSARIQGEQEEIWNLKISLRDESSDYRTALPYMLVAAQPYIGKRTNGEEIVAIREDSPEVADYMSLMGNGR